MTEGEGFRMTGGEGLRTAEAQGLGMTEGAGAQDGRGGLCAVEDFDDVAVLDAVGLAFGAEEAAFAGFGLGAAGDKVVVADDLGADELAGEVAVDGAGGVDGAAAGRDGPGAGFVGAD